MKPENFKLRLRRARKLAVKILESSGYLAFEVTDRRNQFGIIAIDPDTGIAKIVWVTEGENSSKTLDINLLSNISEEIWVKRPHLNEFRVIV